MPSRLYPPRAPRQSRPSSLIHRRVSIRQSPNPGAASVLDLGNHRAPAIIRNISEKGVAFSLTMAVEPGTRLLIELKNRHLGVSYDLGVRVVHARPETTGRWLVGCAFARTLSAWELETLL